MTITGNSVIGEILDHDIGAAQFFIEAGMHCLGCPASRAETIEEACQVHGVEPQPLLAKLNEYFASRG